MAKTFSAPFFYRGKTSRAPPPLPFCSPRLPVISDQSLSKFISCIRITYIVYVLTPLDTDRRYSYTDYQVPMKDVMLFWSVYIPLIMVFHASFKIGPPLPRDVIYRRPRHEFFIHKHCLHPSFFFPFSEIIGVKLHLRPGLSAVWTLTSFLTPPPNRAGHMQSMKGCAASR